MFKISECRADGEVWLRALSCTPRIFCPNPWFTWLHGESYTTKFDSRVSCMHKDVWNCASCKLLSLTSRCHHAHHGVTPVGMMILRSLLRSFVFSTPHRRVWNRDVPHAHAHCTVHTAEKELSNYVHEYLVNIETVFENIFTCFSRAKWGFRTKKLVSLYITFNQNNCLILIPLIKK